MPFYNTIRNTYGPHAVNLMKTYSKLNIKYIKQKNRNIFLLHCKHNQLKPNFLKFNFNHLVPNNVNLKHKFIDVVVKQFVNKTLNLLITDNIHSQNSIKNNIKNTEKKLYETLPTNIVNSFIENEKNKYENFFNKIKNKNIKKINTLKQKQQPPEITQNTTNWIENLSDTQIPDNVQEILSLGPNFAIPTTKNKEVPINDIISSIESNIQELNTTEKDEIRIEISNTLTNFQKKQKNKKIPGKQKTFQNKINQTKKFIKNNPQIVILKPDKSNKTVIMNEQQYDEKMNNLLNDKTTYQLVNNDPTKKLQTENNNLIKRWENKCLISPNTAKKLKINNSLSPKIYGLPKLHKPNIPLRPIISCIQSPSKNLSDYLKSIINNIVNKNKHYIKDSWDFKNKIKNIKIPPNYKLISLDVVSLYTNIPTDLAKKIVEKKWPEIKQYTDLPLKEFLEALDFTLNSTYFQYKDKYYKQIQGCAMGVSVSSVIAQLVLEDLESTIIPQINFQLPFFYRYVDDCITAIPEDKEAYILNLFNSYHNKIKFTIETEENNTLNFLDTTLINRNHQIETKWYTKATWSERYINFKSNHPISQKKSVVINIADRAIKLSDPQHRKHAIKKAKIALKKNNYPEKFTNKIFKNRINKHYNQTTNNNQRPKKQTKYISIPYITGLSEQIQKNLKKHNITICHKGNNLLKSNYSKLKTETPLLKKSHVVYEIPCNECNSVYIGNTRQNLESRLRGHKYDKTNKTALTKHHETTKHNFNFNNTKILATENNNKKREILEMIYIKKNPNSINDKKDIQGLNKMYHKLIA